MKNIKWWDKELIKGIIKIGLPMIFITISFSLSDLIDNISLGLWGKKGDIAISAYAGRLYWMCLLMVFMIPAMFGFLASQYYGAKNYEKEKQTVAMAVSISTIVAVISFGVIYIFGKDIIGLFIKKDENYDRYLNDSFEYVKIFGYIMLIEGIMSGLNLGVTAEGKTKPSAIITSIGIPLNFLLNYLYMKQFGYGYIGSAYSTLTTWSVVVFIFIIWVWHSNHKKTIHFGFNPIYVFRWDKTILIEGFKRIGIGLSTVVAELSVVLTLTVFTRNYSNGALVTSMINPFYNLLLFTGTGVVSTKSYFVGRYLGKGNLKKAYENDCRINLYTFIFSLFNMLVLAALSYPVPMIYAKETSYYQLQATYLLLLVAFTYPFVAVGYAFVSSLSMGGKGTQQFLASSIQPIILEVIVLWVLAVTWTPHFVLLYGIYRIFKASKVFVAYWFWNRKEWIVNVTENNDNNIPIVDHEVEV